MSFFQDFVTAVTGLYTDSWEVLAFCEACFFANLAGAPSAGLKVKTKGEDGKTIFAGCWVFAVLI